MEKLFEYYESLMIYNPERYIHCCEFYDTPLLSKQALDMFIFDHIYHDYLNPDKCWDCKDEIKNYINKMLEKINVEMY